MMDKEVLLQTNHLHVHFPLKKASLFAKRRYVQAVSDVTLTICKGETFGLVGESGCGKSTFADTTLGFLSPTSGEVLFRGEPLDRRNKAAFRAQRSRMQKIFQDPASSLNPRFTVQDAVAEPLRIRGGYTKTQQAEKTAEMLRLVGLSAADGTRYVTEFSGGQQQRIAIARALILKPEYLVCDEPVSALDVSVHAQILNLLMDLQAQLGGTYLFISHNLAAVRKLCGRLAILYMGKVVEYGDTQKIFDAPAHPYTRALIAAVPKMETDAGTELPVLHGDVASPVDPPPGCRFAPRCPLAKKTCAETPCALREIEPDHFTACPYV